MKKIGLSGMKWLKILHIIFVAIWVGGLVGFVALSLVMPYLGQNELLGSYVSLKFLGAVQEDSAVREATIQQQPYSELYPSSRASMDIAQIAKRIDDNKAERAARGGMQFFFRSLVDSIG